MPSNHDGRAESNGRSADSDAAVAAAAVVSATAAPFKPRLGRAVAVQSMDADVLAADGLDVRNCLSLDISHKDPLYSSLIEYAVEKEPAASPSLMLEAGAWRRNQMSDSVSMLRKDAAAGKGKASKSGKKDDGDEQPGDESPSFEPVYVLGPGVTRLPTPDGSWVAIVVAIDPSYPSGGSPPRLVCLYTPLEAGSAVSAPADVAATSDAPAAAADAAAAPTEATADANGVAPDAAEGATDSTAGDGVDSASESATAASADDGDGSVALVVEPKEPHEYARKRLTALIMAVLKWQRAIDKKQRKVGSFQLYRFQLISELRGHWHPQGRHLTRPVDTIVLNPTIRDALLTDAKAFDTKSALRWYTRHGLPYRRCYLFYGPPGTGKSSFIRALAGVLKRSIAFLQCAHSRLNDQILADAFRDCPTQSILVLEDIDCLFMSAAGGVGARESRPAVHISLAGLLNALDGLLSGTRGRITVLTSNHPQLLDSALIRSGRVDHTVEFALPTRADMATLFSNFYPKAEASAATAFADKVFSATTPPEDRTLATMQQLFIKHRQQSATELLGGVEDFLGARRAAPGGARKERLGVYL